jgi:hypothetical protein
MYKVTLYSILYCIYVDSALGTLGVLLVRTNRVLRRRGQCIDRAGGWIPAMSLIAPSVARCCRGDKCHRRTNGDSERTNRDARRARPVEPKVGVIL